MGATVIYLLMLQKIHQFKANNSDRKKYPLCLEYVLKDFLDINAIKTGVNGYVYDISVDNNATAVDDILDINKYLMKKNGIV